MHYTSEPMARLEALQTLEKERTCGKKAELEYVTQHHQRFLATLAICQKLVPNIEAKVLDIGRSPFTAILHSYYPTVSTMGFDPIDDDGGHRENGNAIVQNHITFDINNAKDTKMWPSHHEKFDLITFCETLEHLNTAPEYAIAYLSTLLQPNGILLITTPNAATLKNRISLLCGQNPFEKIRLYEKNPGHFREYTTTEIKKMAQSLNLTVAHCYTINFYRSRYLAPFKLIPAFRDSIVVAIHQKSN